MNLLGHAARKVVECVAELVDKPYRQICESAGIPVLLATSVKKGLDCEWSDPEQKAEALRELTALRTQCTMATPGGRTVAIAEDERLQQRLRKLVATPAGRRRLRERVVEHRLAHVGQRQGRRARYHGTRANLFDLRRACAVQNLETAHRDALAAA